MGRGKAAASQGHRRGIPPVHPAGDRFCVRGSFTTKIGQTGQQPPRPRADGLLGHDDGDVLVLERLPGVSLNHTEELLKQAPDRKQLARDLAEVFLHQFFRRGCSTPIRTRATS